MGRNGHKVVEKLFDLEILAVIVIYLILLTLSLTSLKEFKKLAGNSVGPIEAASVLKADVATYYALHGEWPKDMAAIQTIFPEKKEIYKKYQYGDGMRKRHDVHNGAINTTDGRDNGVITLHPAVTSEDPLSPVIWVAGNRGSMNGWDIFGKDRTTVEERYISRYLK